VRFNYIASIIRLHCRPHPARCTTADRMAAHPRLDGRRVYLCGADFENVDR